MLLAQCPVCQEIFTNSVDCVMSALPCGHVFHKHCMNVWFQTSTTCPQCRIEVKRMNTVVRLFFDTLSLSSQSHRLSATQEKSQDYPCDKSDSLQSLRIELYKTRMENTRLMDTLKETERKSDQQAKLASDREKEILTLTSLYTESDKLCEKERQRSRELRMELMSLKQFLREAESMKTEAIRLRGEMEEMQNVKKLIAASEESARELLSRYSFQKDGRPRDTDNGCNLESLCRWTAVLRTELTSAREKSRNYRIEMSRIRKLQQCAAQRASKAELAVSQKTDRIKQLEKELAVLLNGQSCTSTAEAAAPVVSSHSSTISVHIEPIVRQSSDSTPSPMCISRHHSWNSLTTPDILSVSLTDPLTVELQKKLRTPFENPFRVTCEPPNSRLSADIQKSHSDSPSTSTPTHKAIACENSQASDKRSVSRRRPSVLYEMAIMRRCLQRSNDPVVRCQNSIDHAFPSHPMNSRPTSKLISSSNVFPNSRRTACAIKKIVRPTRKLTSLDIFFSRR